MKRVGVTTLDAMEETRAVEALLRCCGSKRWAREMVAARPFGGEDRLLGTADSIWWALAREDWLEAFAAHPRIGSKRDVDAQHDATKKKWAEGEQAGARSADAATAAALAEANAAYDAKFGRIFIVCATGKSATEMLADCRARLENDEETELRIAAEEQRKITRIRLEKLLVSLEEDKEKSTAVTHPKSITTHVLDTAKGKPAANVRVRLEIKHEGGTFIDVGRGTTDADGRCRTLVPESVPLQVGTYRITFDLAPYFHADGIEGFYPEAAIVFHVRDASQHHHVPLLLSPFGYSTYRGS